MAFDVIKEILSILSSTSGTIILVIGAALMIYGFKLLCSKLGITINNTTMVEIIGIVTQVIKYLDQKFVDVIKKNSPDGTLTEYQQQMVKDKCIEMIISILNSEQIEFLLKKYNMEDIDDVLDILIESTIKDSRSNNSEIVIINENDDNYVNDSDTSVATTAYIPTDEELNSLSLCPGNCAKCSFCNECSIHRVE